MHAGEYSTANKEWDVLRAEVVSTAVHVLFGQFREEAKETLRAVAQDAALRE